MATKAELEQSNASLAADLARKDQQLTRLKTENRVLRRDAKLVSQPVAGSDAQDKLDRIIARYPRMDGV